MPHMNENDKMTCNLNRVHAKSQIVMHALTFHFHENGTGTDKLSFCGFLMLWLISSQLLLTCLAMY